MWGSGVVLAVLIAASAVSTADAASAPASPTAASHANNLTIKDDVFLLNGEPYQIISGSMHYFRIHPAYWEDRLQRARAMGVNTIEAYIPWNWHEPYPGQYEWRGWADVERWLQLIQDAGLKVVLRPGPYICAEWDFGGFPWWLASSKVAGGRTMRLRTADPAYLAHVDRWWAALFPRMRRFLVKNGGPILMVQVENEYGFCGDDKEYLRHLIATARRHLSDDVLLFTTDPPNMAARGSIKGGEVYTVVDFGPAWFNPADAFKLQKTLNEEGQSPPFCSEFYTGWLTHWGEAMANTSTEVLVKDTQTLLEFANSTGSLSFYMIHGGTNFGFTAGAGLDGDKYAAHITSYDYDCPISEAGDYCQPGIGGPCKFHALRDLLARHTGVEPPKPPPRPAIARYGRVKLHGPVPLLSALGTLTGGGGGIRSEEPDIMEEYGQSSGLILYRTRLPPGSLDEGATLDLGAPVHDYASVFVQGRLVGRLDRSQPGDKTLNLPAQKGWASTSTASDGGLQLDILVEAMGRVNFGCDTGGWDFKGLTSGNVTLGGQPLRGWEVFPLPLDDVSGAALRGASRPEGGGSSGGDSGLASARRRLLGLPLLAVGTGGDDEAGAPAFYSGTFSIAGAVARAGGGGAHPADTFLSTKGWGKGIAWVNGFNVGWYWPSRGPQMTLYVPGPVLREGSNELVLLELEAPPNKAAVELSDEPDFWGPGGPAAAAGRQQASTRCSGSLDSGSLSSGDSEDPISSSALNRELERRTGKFNKVAEHLDLLLSASETSSSSVEKCECCRGTGEQECNWCHGTGAMTVGDVLYCSEGGCASCPVCRGTGQCKCPNCCGTGKRASWLAKGPK
ncbi:hypothetical protein ABPG77_001084 [Micractinium sp. CCAP 211/92]